MEEFIIANWKLHPSSINEAIAIVQRYKQSAVAQRGRKVVVCPPIIFLRELVARFQNDFSWGAQDCFWESGGAFTGGVSPDTLKRSGVTYVIIGHSERREFWQETDEMVNKKIKAVLKAKMTPILCVGGGEEAKKRDLDINQLVRKQLDGALRGIAAKSLKGPFGLIVAYEPVWAIGTGRSASGKHAAEVAFFIRWYIDKKYGTDFSRTVPVIYGGSVSAGSAQALQKKSNLNGFLVGGASLNPEEFSKITKT